MSLTAIATVKGLSILNERIKDNVDDFIIIGDKDKQNNSLESLVKDYNTEFEQIKSYVVYKSKISKAYYDADGILTFELLLPYEAEFDKYIYGIGLIDRNETLVSISSMPKFVKSKNIGGVFIYKVAVKGEAGEAIFNYAAQVAFAGDDEFLDENVRFRAIDPYQLKRATVAKADKLTIPRTINGVAFDGTQDITINADPRNHVHTAMDIKDAFMGTLSGTGWTKLPNGLLLQWGTTRFGANYEVTITFPVAFTQCFAAYTSDSSASYRGINSSGIYEVLTNTQCKIFTACPNPTAEFCYWLAIGR